MKWSLFQDSEETVRSAEKKLPHMKAFSLCIDKKQNKTKQNFFFEKSNNKKQKIKQNVIFQLRQFSISFDENFMELEFHPN